MGVGGVAGMMYNGAISGSYNLGTVNTTRNAASFSAGSQYYAVNMGGIVGDTTEGTNASAVLYDVYNKGQIGDETFTYYARHVGGIVGRLSGTVEKAYNTGAIYNGYNVVGGIAGWMFTGNITNSFNTGNITVVNNERETASSQVGGIVGAASTNKSNVIANVYNLGTLRSFRNVWTAGANTVGGIIGIINGDESHQVSVTNAYTTGNIWADDWDSSFVGSIWGNSEVSENGTYRDVAVKNTYYIQPDPDLIDENRNPYFTTLYKNGGNQKDNSDTAIAYADRHKKNVWNFSTTGADDNGFSSQTGGDVTIASGQDWRIYDGNSLPILNAFLPNTEKYFSGETSVTNAMDGIASIQYGTAYDPLLTIINAADTTQNLTFDWQALGANNAAGIAVYGANLTLNDFMATGGSGYFGGLIYSDGALAINAHTDGETHNSENNEVTGNVALGSASQLYGSSVTISADGNVTIYGDVTATGNKQDGTTRSEGKYSSKDYLETDGSISITGGSVDVYGQLTSAKEGKTTFVPGINNMAEGWTPGTVSEPTKPMTDIGDRFGYTTGASAATGNISITANETASEDGHVNVYYGHQQKEFIDTAGSLTVSGSGDVYMDSDLSIGGSLSITAGADSEAVLDISNIGQVQAANDASQGENASSAVSYLHKFLDHFNGADGFVITLNGGKQKIAVNMWGTDEKFDLKKFDLGNDTLAEHLNSLNITANNPDITNQNIVYIWVSTGEELKNIQDYYDTNKDSTKILSYNFALKNDIDASAVTDYVAIGTDSTSGFTGTFDGRDHRIIGLNVGTLSDGTAQSNAGIFDTIGKVTNGENTIVGKVEDLRVYSGTFNGIDNAGAVAGVNYGTISNVTTFGNVVTAKGSSNSTEMSGDTADKTVKVGAAGGIAGINAGTIDNASASDAVTADDGNGKAILSTAGGIAGINQKTISNSSSDSAVNASAGSTYALGGIAGVNAGELSNVDSLGVTTGIYEVGDYNRDIDTQYSDNVGGIAGRNSGTVSEAYNESIVSGRDNVGGILGVNTGASVTDVSNAARVTGEADTSDTSSDKTSDYVGGLVGSNSGSITNGRNNGEITGNQYVGGLVGENKAGSTLSNLVNDEAASITGDNYVGGIAGSNAGDISSQNQKNLVNRGSITGQMYVGGVAGENIGTIEYVKSDIDLNVRDTSAEAKYFGGVAGINKDGGTITNATNSADVIAINADYVGGIVGWNTEKGILLGAGNSNEGRVEGNSYVGGVAGLNEAAITGNRDSMIGIKNFGVVIAHQGGAGGIFGENQGAITYVEMTNNGIVTGTDGKGTGLNGTGGIFGVNSGIVTYSSLKNQVDGQVIGTQNVGGLIGVNTGTITGGRDTGDGYYKYQIYNNGTIQVGTWTDSDKDGKIGTNEFTAAAGENIGGLFGTNSAEVTAAYNTGAIMAGGSTNVGGIAGSNTGTLDQVFNTVMTADGQNQTITGGTNVGGIVGSNEAGGTVSNAYNTSTVNGNEHVGLIAGSNTSTAENSISNVYGTGAANLVGDGNATNVYDSNAKNFGTNGSVIDTTGESSASTVLWRQYGDKNPLLKVFLTTVKYDASKNNQNLVYNGKDQQLDIQGLIDSGAFTAGEEGFTAHKNVSGGLIYHNVTGEHKNAGTYTDNLWSEQIKAGSKDDTFNPNNLGYDVQSVEYDINKAQITIDLDAVDRVYGNTTPIEGKGYGFNYDFSNVYEDAEATLREELEDKLTLGTVTADKDGALKDGGQKTSDAGKYAWEGTVTLADSLRNNYEIVLSDSQKGTIGENNTSITTTGDSNVEKATITVDLIDVNRTYGNADINKTDTNINGNYGVANISGVTNGDDYNENNFDVEVEKDWALAGENSEGRVTNDAGEYTYTGIVTGTDVDGRLNKNYNIVVDGTGKSYVDKANLTIYLDTVNRTYGDTAFTNGTNYGISSVGTFVNGDATKYSAENFVLDQNNISDGALTNAESGKATANAGNYTYTGIVSATNDTDGKLNRNYTIKVTGGNSVVNRKELTVDNIIASIIYGDQGGEGFHITSGGNLEGILYYDDVKLNNNLAVSDSNIVAGSTYAQKKGDRTTADVGTYENSLSYSGLKLTGDDAGNYYIDDNVSGTIEVTKANLTVDINDVHTTYGTAFNPSQYGYTLAGITNKDDENSLRNTIDEAAKGYINTGMDEDDRTNSANGDYELKFNKELGDDTLKNYTITVNNGEATIAQKKLTVSDIVASIIYGDQGNKGFQITSDGKLDGILYNDDVSLSGSGNVSNIKIVEKSEYADNKKNRDTADVGTYEKSLSYSGLELAGEDAGNYYIDGSASGTIEVTKASLTVGLGDVHRTYGDADITNGGYTASRIEGLVNGDADLGYDSDDLTVTVISDGALDTNLDDSRVTNNANTGKDYYTYTGTVAGKDKEGKLNKNYNIVVDGTGKSYVDKANLTINLNNVNMTYGQKESEITTKYGYDASETEGQKLVNGDNLSDVIAGMTYTNTAYNEDGSTKDVIEGGYKLEAGDVTGGRRCDRRQYGRELQHHL